MKLRIGNIEITDEYSDEDIETSNLIALIGVIAMTVVCTIARIIGC